MKIQRGKMEGGKGTPGGQGLWNSQNYNAKRGEKGRNGARSLGVATFGQKFSARVKIWGRKAARR